MFRGVKTLLTLKQTNFFMAVKEYGSLLKFIQQTPQPLRSQLANFLYPLYVYVFLILLKEGKVSDAHKFISCYSKLFLNAQGYASAIQTLFKFKTLHDVWNDSYFKRFCVGKYVVKVSQDSFRHLKSYLEESQSKILLFILNLHFQIEDIKSTSDSNSVEKPPSRTTVINEEFNDNFKCSSTKDGLKTVYELNSSKPSSCLYSINCGKENVCAVDINIKSNLLACGFENSAIHVWNLPSESLTSKQTREKSLQIQLNINESREILSTIADDASPGSNVVLKGHEGSVYGLAYSPSNSLLLSCSQDSTVRAWNMEDFSTVAVYSDQNYPIWDVAVNYSGTYFATASMDFAARLWSFERDVPVRIFAGHSGDVDCVKFHSNSKYIATASADKTIQLWTVQDGRSVRSFCGHKTHISSITFSPNGKHLASADDNGHIKIWDLGSGQQINEIKAHTSRILSIAYNKKGSFIASGGFDKTLKIWDVEHCIDKKVSPSPSANRKKDYHSIELVDSHTTDSVLHFVGFHKKDLLVSVASSTRMDS